MKSRVTIVYIDESTSPLVRIIASWKQRSGMGGFERRYRALGPIFRQMLIFRPEGLVTASEVSHSRWTVTWKFPGNEHWILKDMIVCPGDKQMCSR